MGDASEERQWGTVGVSPLPTAHHVTSGKWHPSPGLGFPVCKYPFLTGPLKGTGAKPGEGAGTALRAHAQGSANSTALLSVNIY